MTWILIVITSVTVWMSPHPDLEACRSAFARNATDEEPKIYRGEIQDAWCVAAEGTDVHWKSADPEHKFEAQ